MAVRLNFDLSSPVQENFLGNNAVYHGFAGLPDKDGRVYSAALCDLEADRAEKMGLRIARTYYDSLYAWDGEKWNFESDTCKAFYKWLQRMKDRNIKVGLNMGWCSPDDVYGRGFLGESPFKVEGDWQQSVKNYALWVSETLHQLIEIRGFTNVAYIFLFTEPQRGGNLSDEISTAYDVWKDCAKAVHEQLTKDNRRHLVKLVGPNEGSTSSSVMNKWVAENADEFIDVYSSHNYQDYIPDLTLDSKNADRCVYMLRPGARLQKTVELEPNTDYVMRVWIKTKIKDRLHISGNFLIGAWDMEKHDRFGSINAGGQPTHRLNQNSIKMFDPAFTTEKVEQYTVNFNSENQTSAKLGVFSDIKEKNSLLMVYKVTFAKADEPEKYILFSDFSSEKSTPVYNVSDPEEHCTDGWIGGQTSITPPADPYYFFKALVHTTRNYIPQKSDIWFDEYNVRIEKDSYNSKIHGTHLSALMLALMNSGVQSSFMWTLFDQQWPNNHTNNNDCFVDGDHRCGVMPVLTRSLTPHPAFYAVSLIIKFMGGEQGTKIYAAEGEKYTHATVAIMPDGNFSLLVVNNKEQSEEILVDFGVRLGLKLNRRLYSPETVAPNENAEIIKTDKILDVGSTLSDFLPSGAVVVYTTY